MVYVDQVWDSSHARTDFDEPVPLFRLTEDIYSVGKLVLSDKRMQGFRIADRVVVH